MKAAPVIRPWTPSDLKLFTALYRSVFPEKLITESVVRRIWNEPASVFLIEDVVASGHREVVGFLYYWTVLDEIEIIDIGIRDDCRRRGLGAELLFFLIEKAHADHKPVRLEVRASNAAAISLYERAEFLRQGQRKRYYANGEDAFLYAYFPAIKPH